MTLYTIGHSNLALAEFLDLLRVSGIGTLVDVRRFPRSRRHSRFNHDSLAAALAQINLNYIWEGQALGGLRDPQPGAERHAALIGSGLHAFAAHMESVEFRGAIDRVLDYAHRARVAIMCAERDPGHCHRSLIADYLTTLGCNVIHLVSRTRQREHRLHPAARLDGSSLIYDLIPQQSLALD